MARGTKWTDEELYGFRVHVEEGMSSKQLATNYGVSLGRISQLRKQIGMLLRTRKVKNDGVAEALRA